MRGRFWLHALIVAIWFGYAWLASAGFLYDWPTYGWFHDHQADAFRHGKLSLPIAPAPELVRAANPYDPVNMRYWVLDASYYEGKYYAYWGPVPALLLAAAKSVLGIDRVVGDQYVQFFHLCLGVACGALLIERIARRLFRGTPRWLVALGILAFAAANPTLHTVASPSTYHTAIAAAQTWLIAGLVVAFDAVWKAQTGAARSLPLALAGTLWALSLASRVTVAPAIALFIVLTAWAVGFAAPAGRWLRFVTSGLVLGMPVALVGCALLVYNKLRFDSYLEFGTNLQLAAFPLFQVSKEYFLPNLYSYLFRTFDTSCRFPYVFQIWRDDAAFPVGTILPKGYMVLEPVVGWFWAIPLTWLIPFAFLFVPRPLGANPRLVRASVWALGSFAALATVTGIVGMGVYGTTMRYMQDVSNGIVFLALMGSYALRTHRLVERYAPRAVSFVVLLLSAATIFFGFALGYHGYNGHVQRFNPELDAKLVKALSVCGTESPKPLRYLP